MISMRHKIKELEKAFVHLVTDEKTRHQAYARALNRSRDKIATKWVQIVTKELKLPPRYVRNGVRKFNANAGNLNSFFAIKGRYETQYKYGMMTGGVKWNKGMAGAVTNGRMHKRAFVARMKNGHVSIFTRLKGQHTKSGKEKLKQLAGPSIARPNLNADKTAVKTSSSEIAMVILEEHFVARAHHEMRRQILNAKAKFGL